MREAVTRRIFLRGFDAASRTLFRMRCLGSCMEPIFPAHRMLSIGDSEVMPLSGERAWLRDSRSGLLHEKYVVSLAGADVDPADSWVAVCNEGMVPMKRNELRCVGKTVAYAVLGPEWPELHGPQLPELDVDEEWRLLRMAEPFIGWLLANPAGWRSEEAANLRVILLDLQRRIDEVDAGGQPTTLVRWRARLQAAH